MAQQFSPQYAYVAPDSPTLLTEIALFIGRKYKEAMDLLAESQYD